MTMISDLPNDLEADKIIWASSGLKRVNGPRSEKPSSEGNVFYVLVFMLCFGL